MGIQGFGQFVRKFAPSVFKDGNLEQFRYCKCAIDIASYIYSWKICLGERWVVGLVQMMVLFKNFDLHCIIVLDSQAPVEKKETQLARRATRDTQANLIASVKIDLEHYRMTGQRSTLLDETYLKIMRSRFEPSILLGEEKFDPESVDYNQMNAADILQWIVKKECQNISVSSNDLDCIRQVLDLLRVPYINALSEAEATCSYLCRESKVDFVISKDSDCVCYGCPTWVSNLNFATGECKIVDYQILLSSMSFTSQMMLDWCIGCGCDYNQRIGGIGPSKMHKLISQHKSLEAVEKAQPDLDCSKLKYHRVREMFAHINTDFQVPFWDSNKFDIVKIEDFLIEKGCGDQIDMIRHQWKPVEFEIDCES